MAVEQLETETHSAHCTLHLSNWSAWSCICSAWSLAPAASFWLDVSSSSSSSLICLSFSLALTCSSCGKGAVEREGIKSVFTFMNSSKRFVTKDVYITLYHNSSVFVLEFHLCGFQLCLCTVQLEEREGRGEREGGDGKERVKEGEKMGEVGGEVVEDEHHKSVVTECILHPTLAANGSVVCTAALCRPLTGGSAWV